MTRYQQLRALASAVEACQELKWNYTFAKTCENALANLILEMFPAGPPEPTVDEMCKQAGIPVKIAG